VDTGLSEEVVMNVEQLRKQAKELVKTARAGDEAALRRLAGREPILARAQLVLAREHGYASWPALVAAAEADADAFVLAATERRRDRAEAMLEAKPEIERDPWAGLVLGHGWRGDPNEAGGPRSWSPLLYACHSVFAPSGLVRELLSRGADPNRRFATEWGETTALYGAAGVVHDAEITRLLLEAGADPDDNESLYHSLEAETTDCLRLLLAHGAEPRGTNAVLHALDFDRLEPIELLLGHGADPNERAYVAAAVRRGRAADLVRVLAGHGADVDRPGDEGHGPGRTAYQHAVLRGLDDVARTLAELGGSTELQPADAAVVEFGSGEAGADTLPETLDADQQSVVIRAAMRGRIEEVVDRFGPHYRGVADGSPPGTLLHHAGWHGNREAVRVLLGRGADPLAETSDEYATPAAWAALGSSWWRSPGFDYVGVMELLVVAGAVLEPRFLDVAHGPLEDWLVERLP
jgi:ankyrin repeat protein